VAVVRVLVEAAVGDEHAAVPETAPERAQGGLDDAAVIPRFRAQRVLARRDSEEEHCPQPGRQRLLHDDPGAVDRLLPVLGRLGMATGR